MKTKMKGIMAVFLSVLMLIMICPVTLLRADAADYYEVEICTYDLLYVTVTTGGNVIKIEPSEDGNSEPTMIHVKKGDSIKIESTAVDGVVNTGWTYEFKENGELLPITSKKDVTYIPESDGALFFGNDYIKGEESYSGTCKDIKFGKVSAGYTKEDIEKSCDVGEDSYLNEVCITNTGTRYLYVDSSSISFEGGDQTSFTYELYGDGTWIAPADPDYDEVIGKTEECARIYPKQGLAAGNYSTTLVIKDQNGGATIKAKVSIEVISDIQVNVTSDDNSKGTVTNGGTYSKGDSVTLTATPSAGYAFSCWKNGSEKVSTDNPYTFTVTGPVTLYAEFVKDEAEKKYTITVFCSATEGTVSGGGTFKNGTKATLTAQALEGYVFDRWEESKTGKVVSYDASYTVEVTEGTSYEAKFRRTDTPQEAIDTAEVSGIPESTKESGSEIKPAPVVNLGGTILKEGADYIVTYSDNVSVGTATVTITGRGYYSGVITRTFVIEANSNVPDNKDNGEGSNGNSSNGNSGSGSNGNSSNGNSGNGSNGNSGNGSNGNGDPNGSGKTYSSEWVNGLWYNADGTQTYEGKLQWKSDSTGWWVEDTSGWYPKSQWQKIDGKWYYFLASGYMDYSEYREGCWLNADGSMDERYTQGTWHSDSTGWWYTDGTWYPVSQYLWIDGVNYYFNASGYMQ